MSDCTDLLKACREIESERAEMQKQRDELLEALVNVLELYVELCNSGDCGNFDAEQDDEVKAARAAIAKVKSYKL